MKTHSDSVAPSDSASQGQTLPPNPQAGAADHRRLRWPSGTAEQAPIEARPTGGSGLSRHGLSDAELDGLLASARAAEAAGQLDDALDALILAAAEITVRGETSASLSPPLFAWMAQLELALGRPEPAEQLASLARDLAIEAGDPEAALDVDVLRTRSAGAALDLDRAEASSPAATSDRTVG